MLQSPNIAHLDFSETGFSIRSDQVMQARERHWYATTNFGIAILRYEDSNALLKDKRLYQGTTGPIELPIEFTPSARRS
jgi:hypothetical protein